MLRCLRPSASLFLLWLSLAFFWIGGFCFCHEYTNGTVKVFGIWRKASFIRGLVARDFLPPIHEWFFLE